MEIQSVGVAAGFLACADFLPDRGMVYYCSLRNSGNSHNQGWTLKTSIVSHYTIKQLLFVIYELFKQ
uniref:Uncharacterized protein n=1 Tax=Romanomermis culicivorax TaxID=13658 RepID=A0A915IYB8_ROMCU